MIRMRRNPAGSVSVQTWAPLNMVIIAHWEREKCVLPHINAWDGLCRQTHWRAIFQSADFKNCQAKTLGRYRQKIFCTANQVLSDQAVRLGRYQVQMSLVGPNAKSDAAPKSSAYRGRPEVIGRRSQMPLLTEADSTRYQIVQ